MNESEDWTNTAGQAPKSGTLSLFLGLYLLVLAFFILLVSISTVEKVKSLAVMDSLSSAFASIIPPFSDLTSFSAREGDLVGAQEFQNQIAGLYATAIQVTKVEIVQPGRLMRLTLPADSLFMAGEARIRDAHFPLLDRTVAALSGRPRGMRFELEFVITSPYAVGTSLPIGQTLETTRANTFVREMLARGAPPDSMSVGLKPGPAGEVTMWFHVRFEEDARKRWVGEGGRRP